MAVDQNHFGSDALLNAGLGCRDCHVAATGDPFEPTQMGGFPAGSMESLIPQRGGVNTPTPVPEPFALAMQLAALCTLGVMTRRTRRG